MCTPEQLKIRDGVVAKNDVAADGEVFRGRVGDILRKNKTDIPIEKGALSILKIVEDAYRDTANFEAVRSPDKAGGRLLKLESPTGVTAKCFEFDWIKDEGNNEEVEMEGDDEWNTEEGDDEWSTEEEDEEEEDELIADEESDEE